MACSFRKGTFQQYVLGPANYVTPIPDNLESAAAAPMLCGGVTVYSGLKKSGASAGQWVAVVGETDYSPVHKMMSKYDY